MLIAMPKIWVAQLVITPNIAAKLSGKHHLTEHEVRQALVCASNLEARGDTHAKYGFRWIVTVYIRGREHTAVLFPAGGVDPDTFNLGTCFLSE